MALDTTMAARSIVVLLAAVAGAAARPSILMIVSDDLRPELGCYGGAAITPNLDAFAATAGTTLFDRAYVQQAICNPSRSSFLTGRRPDTTHVWDLHTHFRNVSTHRNWVTLPEMFLKAGYDPVAGMGKVFHPVRDPATHKIDDVGYSWNRPYYHANMTLGSDMKECYTQRPESIPEALFGESMLAQHAVDTLLNISAARARARARAGAGAGAGPGAAPTPFFVAVGFHRPHLPWDVPGKYYDMYPPAADIPLADHDTPPRNWGPTKPWAWDPQSGPRHCGPLGPLNGTQTRLPEYGLVPDSLARKFRRGYYAAVSEMDHNVGRVLAALDASGLREETVVIFLGDHGWHLGDQGEFGKKTLFERATRIPLIVRDPAAAAAGRPAATTDALVEAVDLLPTLADAASLAVPPTCAAADPGAAALCTEGTSLLPLLRGGGEVGKSAVFMQYPHCMHDDMVWHDACLDIFNASEPRVMGMGLRTRRWRYAEWGPFDHLSGTPTWFASGAAPLGVELYDHTARDVVANAAESVNLAPGANATLRAVMKGLALQLRAGWRGGHESSPVM